MAFFIFFVLFVFPFLQAGSYIIRWTSVLSNRFDSAAFKRVHDDLYKAFTKQVASRRFSISA